MGNLSNLGRIFYGIAVTALGLLIIRYADFPYFLIPPHHGWITDQPILVYIVGALLALAGACIVFGIRTMTVSLILGLALLLVFCFYFVPYQFITTTNYKHYGTWENSAKELAFAGGAFVIAGCFSTGTDNALIRALKKLIPLGTILFALTIISFSIDHFLFAVQAAGYVPAWVPAPVSWIYVTGVALFCSGLAILLNIKAGLAAFLLGAMIFIWVIIVHLPKAVNASFDEHTGEVSSTFIALACCGIAFVIAGNAKKIVL
jgi:uncharacterized membrane protein